MSEKIYSIGQVPKNNNDDDDSIISMCITDEGSKLLAVVTCDELLKFNIK